MVDGTPIESAVVLKIGEHDANMRALSRTDCSSVAGVVAVAREMI